MTIKLHNIAVPFPEMNLSIVGGNCEITRNDFDINMIRQCDDWFE